MPGDNLPASPAETLVASGFDVGRYLADNLDMEPNGITGLLAASHFYSHGLDERRRAPIDTSLGVFAAGLRAAGLPRRDEIIRAAASFLAVHHFSVLPPPDRLLRHMDGGPGFRPLLVVGDSHAQTYAGHDGALDAGYLPLTLILTGGSARGLANPASRSGYGRMIRLFLQEAGPRLQAAGGHLLFKFGQVDVEFVYDLRRVDLGQAAWNEANALAYFDQSIAAYVGYAAALRPLLPAGLKPIVATIFPPALGDAAIRRGYHNHDITLRYANLQPEEVYERMRGFEFPNLPTRTRLHAEFNRRLIAAARQAGLRILDDHTPLLDDGALAACFTASHGGDDHHIDRHVPEAAHRLAALLRSLDG